MNSLNVVEAVGTILGMAACVIMNVSSHDPNMFIILTMYCLSAILLAATSYARRTQWIASLMAFYALMGFYGIYNLAANT